jgi:putative ATP-binding cassette transporter
MVPSMSRARVAAEQLLQLRTEMPEAAPPQLPATAAPACWREIRLNGVVHRFDSGGGESSFVVGPVDLVLEPGEIVFLTGGNGSGKTTLAKLLVGLYTPEAGSITLDGKPVQATNIEDYRSLFTTVFSDFHLFGSLLGLERPGLDDDARDHLALLRLDQKVHVNEGVFSTIELSQGQRKRLALLTAYLEDRPIYVFDEWTADQEPLFREVFYRHLLPGLRERSKTAIVITHDDRYFEAADRVIELDYGRIRGERVLRKGVAV